MNSLKALEAAYKSATPVAPAVVERVVPAFAKNTIPAPVASSSPKFTFFPPVPVTRAERTASPKMKTPTETLKKFALKDTDDPIEEVTPAPAAVVDIDPIENDDDDDDGGGDEMSGFIDNSPVSKKRRAEASASNSDDDEEEGGDGDDSDAGDSSSADSCVDSDDDEVSESSEECSDDDEDDDNEDEGEAWDEENGDDDVSTLLSPETLASIDKVAGSTTRTRGTNLRANPRTTKQAQKAIDNTKRAVAAARQRLVEQGTSLRLTGAFKVNSHLTSAYNAARCRLYSVVDDELLKRWFVTRITATLRANFFGDLVRVFEDASDEAARKRAHGILETVVLTESMRHWLNAFNDALLVMLKLHGQSESRRNTPLAQFFLRTRELAGARTLKLEKCGKGGEVSVDGSESKLKCTLSNEFAEKGAGYLVHFTAQYVDIETGKIRDKNIDYFVLEKHHVLFYHWFIMSRLPELISASADREIVARLTAKRDKSMPAIPPNITAAELGLSMGLSITQMVDLLLCPPVDSANGDDDSMGTTDSEAPSICMNTTLRANSLGRSPTSAWAQKWINTIASAVSGLATFNLARGNPLPIGNCIYRLYAV